MVVQQGRREKAAGGRSSGRRQGQEARADGGRRETGADGRSRWQEQTIFHFSFFIFHLSFRTEEDRQWKMTDDK
jgi:hypothetical protein